MGLRTAEKHSGGDIHADNISTAMKSEERKKTRSGDYESCCTAPVIEVHSVDSALSGILPFSVLLVLASAASMVLSLIILLRESPSSDPDSAISIDWRSDLREFQAVQHLDKSKEDMTSPTDTAADELDVFLSGGDFVALLMLSGSITSLLTLCLWYQGRGDSLPAKTDGNFWNTAADICNRITVVACLGSAGQDYSPGNPCCFCCLSRQKATEDI